MVTETMEKTQNATLLRRALAGNGIFSLVSGFGLMAAASSLAAVMGVDGPAALQFVGAILVPYGAFLLWAASQRPINRTIALSAILLDIAWVFGSLLLLLTALVAFSPAGKWIVAILADVVALFAIAQYIGLRRELGP